MSPSGIVSISVRSMPRPCAKRTSSAISSSLTPFSATALILTASPASCAASIPPSTLVEIAPARDRLEFFRVERVERDVDPPTPADVSSAAYGELAAVGRQRQLVERPGLQMPAERANSLMMFLRTSGSPPVRRISDAVVDERGTEPVQLFQGQQIRFGRNVMSSAMQ